MQWGSQFALHFHFGAISGLSGTQERCRVGSFAELSFSEETESLSYVSLTEVQHRIDGSFKLWIFFNTLNSKYIYFFY